MGDRSGRSTTTTNEGHHMGLMEAKLALGGIAAMAAKRFMR